MEEAEAVAVHELVGAVEGFWEELSVPVLVDEPVCVEEEVPVLVAEAEPEPDCVLVCDAVCEEDGELVCVDVREAV